MICVASICCNTRWCVGVGGIALHIYTYAIIGVYVR